jgi:protein-tyrosine phosphatase
VKDTFWINHADHGAQSSLAIVLRPRGGDWLEDALVGLRRDGVNTLVSMLEEWEADFLGLAEEPRLAGQSGMTFLSYPIPDRETPTNMVSFDKFVTGLAARARAGERIGVHCRGSIGRSTIATACTLVHLGWTALAALKAIESARGCTVPDTDEQREWIIRYGGRH